MSMLSGSTNGRATLAALGLLLAATATGLAPVGKFFAPPPAPKPPVSPPRPQPPTPLAPVTSGPSRGKIQVGPVALEAVLGQSRVLRGGDGTLFLDLKVTAAESAKTDGERRPVDLALVLDVSGSMADDNKITLLRQACLGLASELGSSDRVAVVSFSDEASVLFPLQTLKYDGPALSLPLEAPEARYMAAIRQLVPCGATNLSAGLEAGAAELRRAGRPGASRRLLLLTDGIANRGVSEPNGLRGLVSHLGSEGFSVSTVGLGLDYNAGLLSMLGDVGGGNYFYVDAAQKISAVYASELRGMRALVAKSVRVSLKPAAGVAIEQVVSWSGETTGDGRTLVTLGDLEAGRTTKIVVQLRVPTNQAVSAQDVVAVTFAGEAAGSGELLAPSPVLLGVGVTDDSSLALASVATDVQKDLVNARVARELDRARVAAEQGRLQDARRAFDELRRMKVEQVEFKGADGRVESAGLATFESALCAPGSAGSAAAAKCEKDMTAASRSSGR